MKNPDCPICHSPMISGHLPEGTLVKGTPWACTKCGMVMVSSKPIPEPEVTPEPMLSKELIQELIRLGVVGVVVRTATGGRVTIDFI